MGFAIHLDGHLNRFGVRHKDSGKSDLGHEMGTPLLPNTHTEQLFGGDLVYVGVE